MSDVSIYVEDLGKKYVIGHESRPASSTLRDVVTRGAHNLIRAAGRTPVPVPEIVLKLAFGRFGLPALPPGAVAHLKYPVVIDDSSFRTATGYNNKYDEDQTIAAFRSVAG